MLRIIAGTHRGRKIEAPEGRDTRPTLDRVRENLFNMLQMKTRDAEVLDLFGGSGALSLEALSRGAAFAVISDRDREACRIEQNNVKNLGLEGKTRLMRGEWQQTVRTLTEEGARFDLIFLDPPYAMKDLRELTEKLDPLLAEDGWVILEHQAGENIQVSSRLALVKERSWGYCGVKIFERLCDSGVL